MTTSTSQQEYAIELSREEQWVLYHVVLDRMERERTVPGDVDPPPLDIYRVFEKIEAGCLLLSPSEVQCVEDELRQYTDAGSTPERDRPVAEQILAEFPSVSHGESS